MAVVTICSDSGAQENKICHCFHCFPIYLPWSDRTWCHDLSFLNVEFCLFLILFLTLQYCIGFAWICHRYTRVPHPEPSSLLPPCTIPLSFKAAFSLSSFISSRGSLSFLPLGWCHLHIWGYWYFSRQSWFQLELHSAWHLHDVFYTEVK